ncbi:DUF6090 family protein [Cryomorphaceae bacterium 1068]|nr:DUF6090 family protein [Cryomorphaceae bacterium 1068]
MIKLFRKIRRRLLSEGKFSNYLLYAIGEIVLVVIGILIALQINTSSQRAKDQAQEQVYLKSFQIDLEKDIQELDRVIAKATRVSVLADSLLMFFENRDLLDDETLEPIILELSNFTIYLSHEGTVRDIVGSGDLDLIQSDSVRIKMASWEADLKSIREWESLSKEATADYMDYLGENIDMYKRESGKSMIDEESKARILEDRYFLNLVARRYHEMTILARLYQSELESTLNTLKVVKSELRP